MLFEGKALFSGQPIRIQVSGGSILSVEPMREGEGGAEALPLISPGLIDIQVNGYQGRDYSSPELRKEDILHIVQALIKSGTLRHLPTIITQGQDTMLRNLALIRQAVSEEALLGLAIPGIHLEGPYLSPKDGARGAHSLRHIRQPDLRELDAWQEAAGGLIRLITLAPEAPGALPFIRQARSLNIKVALGHSLASRQQIDAAVEAGASLSTHLGNGSPALLPRLNNPIWAQLAQDRLMASIISDGFHLPDEVIHVFARAKGLKRLMLTSDVGPMGGLAPGRYPWGDTLVEVAANGRLGVADTEYLAGAGHLLDRCIPVFMRASGASLQEAIRLASQQPAAFLGLEEEMDIRIGQKANLISFVQQDGQLKLRSAALGEFLYTF